MNLESIAKDFNIPPVLVGVGTSNAEIAAEIERCMGMSEEELIAEIAHQIEKDAHSCQSYMVLDPHVYLVSQEDKRELCDILRDKSAVFKIPPVHTKPTDLP